MNFKPITFKNKENKEFFRVVTKRVNAYFKENKINKHGNFSMYFKSVFMFALYLVPFILMLTGVVTQIGWITLMWVLMGFGVSGVGLSIMHDANHGSYSKNKKVNLLMRHTLNLLGGNDMNWRIQHNVLHHSYTNIDGYDEDILSSGVLRLSPNQEKKKLHKFQAYYAWLIYGLTTLYWISAKDFQQLYRYHKNGLMAGQNYTYKRALTETIIMKIVYVGVTLVLPIILLPIPWWTTVLLFIMMHFICGLILTLIFQSAHVVKETQFELPGEDHSVENNWAVHQMLTTADFAQKSGFFSWFIGGLNFQVEHHLFPNICHVHYKKIAKIVRETANEFHLPYYTQPTFFHALKSHFGLLNQLGKAAA
jgi:linoleoyl-CoA desaturase